MTDVSYAFPVFLAFLAGISTLVGGLISFAVRKVRFCYLCVAFGFSAGAMIFISFTELLSQGIKNTTFGYAILGFFGGAIIIYLIDVLIPHTYEEETCRCNRRERIKRTSILLVLGVAIHNFPEGIAVTFSSILDVKLGVLIAFAVAMHNIPEGIAVSMPVYYATRDRKKALYYAFLSGIVEPIGAVVSLLFLHDFLSPFTLGIILSAVAGIMIFISFDELLPYVYKHREDRTQHLAILGLFIGMLVMALTSIVLTPKI
ncbi:MAG: zinc transporter ZupT [Candidatus Altiarchaeales archaeon]|nr:zinc transporter ZupT [Candidatus Altiarchaeales archaeon]